MHHNCHKLSGRPLSNLGRKNIACIRSLFAFVLIIAFGIPAPLKAGSCSDLRIHYSEIAKAKNAECQAMPYGDPFSGQYTGELHRAQMDCYERNAQDRRKASRKVSECRAHQRRMFEDQRRRKAESVKERERLRRAEEEARRNHPRGSRLSRIYEKLQSAKDKYNKVRDCARDLNTLSHGQSSRVKIEAVNSLAKDTNSRLPRLELSRQITDAVLDGVTANYVSALEKFESAFEKTRSLNVVSREADRLFRAQQRKIGAASNSGNGTLNSALARQREVERMLARERGKTYKIQARGAQQRNAKARQRARAQAAAQQRNNEAFVNGLVRGLTGAAAIYGATRGRGGYSAPTQKKSAPRRNSPSGGGRGCTDGEAASLGLC